MSDLNNILSQGAEPNEEALKRYLEGTASPEERFAIENKMADEAFMNDAVEGLQSFKDPQLIQDYVTQLNSQIQKQTNRKIQRKIARRLKDQNWTIIAIVLVLLLCLLAYFTIHLSQKHKMQKTAMVTVPEK